MKRLVDPIVSGKCHVCINPRDVLPISRKRHDAEVDQVFLVPELIRAAHLHRARAWRRDFEMPIPQRQLYRRQNRPGVCDVLFKLPE